jgi:hypothetical protein
MASNITRVNFLKSVVGKKKRISTVKGYFGGTNRSAISSFNLRRPVELVSLSHSLSASIAENPLDDTIDLGIYVNGPGYVDSETGELHGYGEDWSKISKLGASMLGLGQGNMDDNADEMVEMFRDLEKIIDPNTKIYISGYSRGGVSAAKSSPLIKEMLSGNEMFTKIFDPVAGPLDQAVQNVSGTNTLVQYSLDNNLPFFWATPVVGAGLIILARGGHSTMARGKFGRLGNLDVLDPGVHIEHNNGALERIEKDAAIKILESLHDAGGTYPEVPSDTSRYKEIIQAIKHMKYSS